jgi:hypothetical protein
MTMKVIGVFFIEKQGVEMKLNLGCVAAKGLCLFFIAPIAGMVDARAAGPTVSADIDTSEMFSQRYDVTYYDGAGWPALRPRGGNVKLNPRFSMEGSGAVPWSFYKYAIELKDKRNKKSSFYVFLSTSKEPCMIHQTSSSDNFLNETMGIVYSVTTQYVNLATPDVQNSSASVAYQICSRPDVVSVRFFDPITSGIPVGIGAHVYNQAIRISETYIVLNTEGILYPQ